MLLFLAPLMYIGDFKASRQAFAVAITEVSEGKAVDSHRRIALYNVSSFKITHTAEL